MLQLVKTSTVCLFRINLRIQGPLFRAIVGKSFNSLRKTLKKNHYTHYFKFSNSTGHYFSLFNIFQSKFLSKQLNSAEFRGVQVNILS